MNNVLSITPSGQVLRFKLSHGQLFQRGLVKTKFLHPPPQLLSSVSLSDFTEGKQASTCDVHDLVCLSFSLAFYAFS